MPPSQRKTTTDPDALKTLIEQTREDIARLGQAVDRLGPEQGVRTHDEDGWVVQSKIWVDENSIRVGDLVSFPPVPGRHPIVGRYMGKGFRYEVGGQVSMEYAPKPWRLVWRSLSEWESEAAKKEIEAPKGRRSRAKKVSEPEVSDGE